MRAISGRGVRLAIDDFGTGYSSMSLMKHFPIDTIKIDRCFVQDIVESSPDRAISAAIITLGRSLGIPRVSRLPNKIEFSRIPIVRNFKVSCSVDPFRQSRSVVYFLAA